MPELTTRQTAARTIRNIRTFTQEERFANRLLIEIRTRLKHLENAWTKFITNHTIILNIAIENKKEDEIREHHELYDETEICYLDAKTLLEDRDNQARADDDSQSDYSIQNDNSQENHNDNNDDDNIIQDNNDNPNQILPPVNVNNDNNVEQNSTPPILGAADVPFAMLIQRMCAGLANKKENTWGVYSGELESGKVFMMHLEKRFMKMNW